MRSGSSTAAASACSGSRPASLRPSARRAIMGRVEACTERTIRGACPHDCPDTCAMLTTVDESGRATAIAGDPEHPITQGFLCGKVSNYLDRVYAEDRILHPLIRTGAKGAGE